MNLPITGELLPAPDGTELATDRCLPPGPGPFPAVLIRTPYGRRNHHRELRSWAARGFAALAQDVRGRHGSKGEWHPYRHETADGTGAVRELRRQPWCDGSVVVAGGSYAAYCALRAALAPPAGRPDAVIAAVPALGLAETARETTGPERLGARAGWWAAHGDRRDSDPGALARLLSADPQLTAHLPVLDLPRRLGRPLPSWPRVWRAGPGGILRAAPRATVPLLVVGGSHDPFAEDALRLWEHWGAPARLLYGPWGHGLTAEPGPDATAAHRLGLGELYVRWARAALEGRIAAGRTGCLALGGTPLWLRAPGAGQPRAYPLETLRLLRGPRFTADPAAPVRSDTLRIPRDGPDDRVLLVSDPLEHPLDLAGRAELRLRAAADTGHADWAARLAALAPDGRAHRLALGIVRYRGTPGGSAELTVPLGPVTRRLPAGTRLRLEITGHHFPAHARNPHTGENPVTATVLRPSLRSVEPARSTLLLPVLSPGRAAASHDPAQEICR
ncbi:CocE/NonD family hydrolase [Streptomyces sodiiphilus]|uniref:CocE/NonD family hydrolase n=1 Tax=Streptomyces sodiiphilus TaxID=226217 RepID=A0ABN2NYQ5_9ACTN